MTAINEENYASYLGKFALGKGGSINSDEINKLFQYLIDSDKVWSMGDEYKILASVYIKNNVCRNKQVLN